MRLDAGLLLVAWISTRMNKSKKTGAPVGPKRASRPATVRKGTANPKKQRRVVHPDVDARYLAALAHPFSPMAVGVRAPSTMRRHTTASTIRFRGGVTTSAAGAATVIFTANPACAAFIVSGSSFAGNDTYTGTYKDGGAAQIVGAPVAELRKLGNYRIVSAGVKFTSYVADSANGGRACIGTFTTNGELPIKPYAVLSGAAGAAGVLSQPANDASWNFNNDGLGKFFQVSAADTGSIDYTELTDKVVSVQDLRTKSIVATMRPTLESTGPWLQGEPSTYIAAGGHNTDSPLGFNSVCLVITDGTPSTASVAFEIVYHVEQIDIPIRSNVGSGTNASSLTSAKPGTLDHTNAVAATQPHVFEEVEAGAAGAMAATTAASMYTSAYALGSEALATLGTNIFGFLPELGAALPLLLAPIGL